MAEPQPLIPTSFLVREGARAPAVGDVMQVTQVDPGPVLAAFVPLPADQFEWVRVAGPLARLHPRTVTDAVVIGDTALSGTERFRQTGGAALFDGTTGATPVSGAGTRFMWIPAKGALRAGVVTGTDWDDANIGVQSFAFGVDCRASGAQSFAGPNNCDALAPSSVALGDGAQTRVGASFGFAHGRRSLSKIQGHHAYASGFFSASGDAQTGVFVVRNTTIEEGEITTLFIDGASVRMVLDTDTTWAFSILLVARRSDGNNESAAFKFEGCIDNNAGTVALVGTIQKTILARDTAAIDADVNASDANDSLDIDVNQGAAAGNWSWVARVELSELTA